MQILHISDTHGFHGVFPDFRFRGIDMVIHSGDCSNYRDPYRNSNEVLDFIEWFKKIPVKYKIFVAGNHDTSIERRLVTPEFIKEQGIIYLENESITIEGLNIFGSPITPTFGDWAFMKKREKMHKFWSQIPDDTNILIVHGPPKGIRDLSFDRHHNLEMCGDLSLYKRILELKHLKAMMFGHIHNTEGVHNQGISINHNTYLVVFSNGSCVDDGRFDRGLTSFGNIFYL